eukprot:8322431-Alexandrium_andersonii.AAC.1
MEKATLGQPRRSSPGGHAEPAWPKSPVAQEAPRMRRKSSSGGLLLAHERPPGGRPLLEGGRSARDSRALSLNCAVN